MKFQIFIKKNYTQIILVVVAYIILITSAVLTKQPIYKTLTTLLSIIMLMFLINGSPFSFIIGIVYYTLFGITCYFEKVYGAVFLSFFISVPLQIFSIINWRIQAKKLSDNKNKSPIIKALSTKLRVLSAVLTLTLALILYFILKKVGSSNPLFDSLAVSFAITSLILLVFARYENWFYNIFSNLFNAILWASLIPVNISNINIFLISLIFSIYGIVGFVKWIKYSKLKTLN